MYQPRWLDGRTVGTSRRDAEGRYRAIVTELQRLDRAAINQGLPERSRDTVLDFGAHTGYFAARLADEHGAAVTAVDDTPGLADLDHPDVTVINRRLTNSELFDLGTFDVGLCLSVLHHLPDWRTFLATLLESCSVLFVETANPNEHLPKAIAHKDSTAIEEEMIEEGGRVIHHTPGHDSKYSRPLWVLQS